MFYKVEYQKRAHQEVEKIFRVLLPEQGLAVREEQIRLCHEMLDTLLGERIALCDAGVGIGKTYLFGITDLCISTIRIKLLELRTFLVYFNGEEKPIYEVEAEKIQRYLEFVLMQCLQNWMNRLSDSWSFTKC